MICVILRQTHFQQVTLTRNITSHTLKGLITTDFQRNVARLIMPVLMKNAALIFRRLSRMIIVFPLKEYSVKPDEKY